MELYKQAMNGNTAEVIRLLDNGESANSAYTPVGRTNPVTAIEIAVMKGHVGVVDALIQHGADVSVKGSHVTDCTPTATLLEHATYRRNYNMVLLLLQHGADVNARDTHNIYNYGDLVFQWGGRTGTTPLLQAIRWDAIDIANILINWGADVSIRDHNGWGTLHATSKGGHVQLTDRILKINPRLKLDVERWGFTPLHIAVYHGSVEVVKVFINHGVNPFIPDSRGQTPVDMAFECDQLDIFRLLTCYIYNLSE
jgi:ankyrin repeat protein